MGEIKRKEIPALKATLRNEIAGYATTIRKRLTEKQAIPRSVVDGTYSEVIAYKELAESALGIYHVQHAPGFSLSLAELSGVRDRLKATHDILEGVHA